MVGEKLEGSLAEAALMGSKSARLGSGRSADVLMSLRGVSDGENLTDISLDIHRGEVLGISGLLGSGQSELARILAGARSRRTGEVLLSGKTVPYRSPAEAIRLGVGYLPQDRKEQGFIPEMSVSRNMTLANLAGFSKAGFLTERREKEIAQGFATRLAMRISGIDQKMRTLSGGTQQKVIFARWLVRSAKLLICDEPTRGVDVEAKEEVYALLRDFVREGGTVLIASSELSEALMCDRVLVMARGRIAAELDRTEIDPEGRSIIEHYA
jgi:ribose transport system ATP-binding protein